MEADNIAGGKEPKRLPVWACIPLFIVILFILLGLYGTLARGCLSLVLGVEARHPGVMGYIILEASMLLAVLTAAIPMLRFERRPFSDLGLSLKGHVKGLWYGFLMAILLYLFGFGISFVLGEIEVTGFQFKPLDLLGSWVFFLLVALFEEILMRGYILGRLLHTTMNKFLALFVSAALFAFMHIFNPEIAFLPMLNLLLAGMLLGASYLYTRNLCFPISLHLFWNWIQGPILGYQVGGAFGFEGSLICTVLMIVFTILIVWWGEKREAISLAVPRSC